MKLKGKKSLFESNVLTICSIYLNLRMGNSNTMDALWDERHLQPSSFKSFNNAGSVTDSSITSPPAASDCLSKAAQSGDSLAFLSCDNNLF